ncbi:hypothetical protein GYA44_01340 [Candidatus Microgenomates bacterium]|nr:hypothetical protein [Candidatus Microgenomates bacterium]
MKNKNKIINLLQISIGDYSVIKNLSSWSSVDSVVGSKIITALNFFVGFSALIAVALLVVAGYNFITSMGDPDKVEKAQKGATAAVVGMIIVFLARVIVEFILKITLG